MAATIPIAKRAKFRRLFVVFTPLLVVNSTILLDNQQFTENELL